MQFPIVIIIIPHIRSHSTVIIPATLSRKEVISRTLSPITLQWPPYRIRSNQIILKILCLQGQWFILHWLYLDTNENMNSILNLCYWWGRERDICTVLRPEDKINAIQNPICSERNPTKRSLITLYSRELLDLMTTNASIITFRKVVTTPFSILFSPRCVCIYKVVIPYHPVDLNKKNKKDISHGSSWYWHQQNVDVTRLANIGISSIMCGRPVLFWILDEFAGKERRNSDSLMWRDRRIL